jgi:predicted metal-dependent peptidase
MLPLKAYREQLEATSQSQASQSSHLPVFDWLKDHNRRPDLFIGMTDLYSRFPDDPPPFPVLWITQGRRGKAPWGRVLEVTPS